MPLLFRDTNNETCGCRGKKKEGITKAPEEGIRYWVRSRWLSNEIQVDIRLMLRLSRLEIGWSGSLLRKMLWHRNVERFLLFLNANDLRFFRSRTVARTSVNLLPWCIERKIRAKKKKRMAWITWQLYSYQKLNYIKVNKATARGIYRIAQSDMLYKI